jgi:primosomal protein N''
MNTVKSSDSTLGLCFENVSQTLKTLEKSPSKQNLFQIWQAAGDLRAQIDMIAELSKQFKVQRNIFEVKKALCSLVVGTNASDIHHCVKYQENFKNIIEQISQLKGKISYSR